MRFLRSIGFDAGAKDGLPVNLNPKPFQGKVVWIRNKLPRFGSITMLFRERKAPRPTSVVNGWMLRLGYVSKESLRL